MAACSAEFLRVYANRYALNPAALSLLVAASTAGLSDWNVSTGFCRAVSTICAHETSMNRELCGAAGIIPAVLLVMSTHGADSATVSAEGCEALACMSSGHAGNADAIILSAGGLGAILSVMASHPGHREVQLFACRALSIIAGNASRAALTVMRENATVLEMRLSEAKSGLPGAHDVRDYADTVPFALAFKLRPLSIP